MLLSITSVPENGYFAWVLSCPFNCLSDFHPCAPFIYDWFLFRRKSTVITKPTAIMFVRFQKPLALIVNAHAWLSDFFDYVSHVCYRVKLYNRELKHATFLNHGRTPEMYCFPILLVFTLPHLYLCLVAGFSIKKCKPLRTRDWLLWENGRVLNVRRGLRAINQESLVALSIEISTATAPFLDKWS